MNNVFRFLIGILVFIGVIIIGLLLLAFALPFIFVGSVLYIVIIAIFVVLGAIAFIWYMSRNEKPRKKNKKYSIKKAKSR